MIIFIRRYDLCKLLDFNLLNEMPLIDLHALKHVRTYEEDLQAEMHMHKPK